MACSNDSDSGRGYRLNSVCTFVFALVKKPIPGRALPTTGAAKVVKQMPSASGNVHTFKDVPKPPEPMLRLTLRHKSTWKRFKSTVREFPQQYALRNIEAERQKILQEAYKRGSLSPDDVNVLNQSMREEITRVFDEFKKNLQETIKIEHGESAESALLKIGLVEEITQWLKDLMKWLNEELNAVLSKIKDKGPQWCIQQAECLFQKLYVAFAEHSHPEPQGVPETPEEGEDVVSRLCSLGM